MCLYPKRVLQPDGSYREFSCGHCTQCLKLYQDVWTARLNEELRCWPAVLQDDKKLPPVVFFTLDYNPECVPCTYLVCTSAGVYTTDERPSCRILEFWSDTRREDERGWLARRHQILAEYAAYVSRFAGIDEYDLACGSVEFYRFDNGSMDYPKLPKHIPYASPVGTTPELAIEFHSVDKRDIQGLFKRARRRFEREHPDGTDRQDIHWRDIDGELHELPACAISKTWKMFLTSEYGPQTFRPHYHGVIFGLTYDEFERYIAKDWSSYGHCDFSVLRPTGGAITYLSKYCSKGEYEHPLCCKHFIYPSGKEYHSDKFEICVAAFGLNVALVRPTFHSISKGLGACYAFRAEIQQFFSAHLVPSDNGKDFVNVDKSSYIPKDLDELLCLLPNGESGYSSIQIEERGTNLVIRRYEHAGWNKNFVDGRVYFSRNLKLIGESVIPFDAICSQAYENHLLTKNYSRVYVSHSNKDRGGISCLSCWHKIGASLPLSHPEVHVSHLSLPRYYRRWLLSPAASALRASAAARLYPSGNEKVSGEIRPSGEFDLNVDDLRRANQLQEFLQGKAGRFRFSDDLNPSFFEALASEEIRRNATSARLSRSARNFLRNSKSPRLM